MPVRFRVTSFVHLLPALAAVLAAAALLANLEARAGARLKRSGPELASLNLPEATRGVVLQRRIFEMPNCLPVYGSSELSIAQPTRADLFFHRKRQGFDVCVVGQAGDRCLIMLQELAALGAVARGRKVAVFLSPLWFLTAPETERQELRAHDEFAATFSPSQASRFAVDCPLDPTLKREIAACLLEHGDVIQARSPLLCWAMVSLRERTWPQRCVFVAMTPLLALQNQVLSWQEQYHWFERVRDNRQTLLSAGRWYKPRGKQGKSVDWARVAQDIDRMEAKRNHATFYSEGPALEDSQALHRAHRHAPSADPNGNFLRRMNEAAEWNHLELLLRVTRELDINVLLIDQPINGLLSDQQGVTPAARRAYYDKVRQLATRYRVALRDFSGYEEDHTFFMDGIHPSAEAWVHYDEALEEFYQHKHF